MTIHLPESGLDTRTWLDCRNFKTWEILQNHPSSPNEWTSSSGL